MLCYLIGVYNLPIVNIPTKRITNKPTNFTEIEAEI